MVACPLLLGSRATGMKILPPARKLASCPLIATMFGSARILTRPSRFSPSIEDALAVRSHAASALGMPAPRLSRSLSRLLSIP